MRFLLGSPGFQNTDRPLYVWSIAAATSRKVEWHYIVFITFFIFFSFVHFAAGKVDALMRNGVDLVEALNSSSVFLVQAAMVSRKHAGKSNASWDLIICAVLELTCLIL